MNWSDFVPALAFCLDVRRPSLWMFAALAIPQMLPCLSLYSYSCWQWFLHSTLTDGCALTSSCAWVQFFEQRGVAVFDLLPMCSLEQPYVPFSSTSTVNLLQYNHVKRRNSDARITTFEDGWDALLDLDTCASPS